jgi:hypothetical protein
MSLRSNLKVDFSKWASHPSINQLTKQITTYEKRVSTLVKDFDLKGREARERSRKKLDKVLGHLKQTRSKVEKKVTHLVTLEGKKLNKKVNELLDYVNQMSRQEDRKMAASSGRAKKTSRNTKKAGGRSSKTRAKR